MQQVAAAARAASWRGGAPSHVSLWLLGISRGAVRPASGLSAALEDSTGPANVAVASTGRPSVAPLQRRSIDFKRLTWEKVARLGPIKTLQGLKDGECQRLLAWLARLPDPSHPLAAETLHRLAVALTQKRGPVHAVTWTQLLSTSSQLADKLGASAAAEKLALLDRAAAVYYDLAERTADGRFAPTPVFANVALRVFAQRGDAAGAENVYRLAFENSVPLDKRFYDNFTRVLARKGAHDALLRLLDDYLESDPLQSPPMDTQTCNHLLAAALQRRDGSASGVRAFMGVLRERCKFEPNGFTFTLLSQHFAPRDARECVRMVQQGLNEISGWRPSPSVLFIALKLLLQKLDFTGAQDALGVIRQLEFDGLGKSAVYHACVRAWFAPEGTDGAGGPMRALEGLLERGAVDLLAVDAWFLVLRQWSAADGYPHFAGAAVDRTWEQILRRAQTCVERGTLPKSLKDQLPALKAAEASGACAPLSWSNSARTFVQELAAGQPVIVHEPIALIVGLVECGHVGQLVALLNATAHGARILKVHWLHVVKAFEQLARPENAAMVAERLSVAVVGHLWDILCRIPPETFASGGLGHADALARLQELVVRLLSRAEACGPATADACLAWVESGGAAASSTVNTTVALALQQQWTSTKLLRLVASLKIVPLQYATVRRLAVLLDRQGCAAEAAQFRLRAAALRASAVKNQGDADAGVAAVAALLDDATTADAVDRVWGAYVDRVQRLNQAVPVAAFNQYLHRLLRCLGGTGAQRDGPALSALVPVDAYTLRLDPTLAETALDGVFAALQRHVALGMAAAEKLDERSFQLVMSFAAQVASAAWIERLYSFFTAALNLQPNERILIQIVRGHALAGSLGADELQRLAESRLGEIAGVRTRPSAEMVYWVLHASLQRAKSLDEFQEFRGALVKAWALSPDAPRVQLAHLAALVRFGHTDAAVKLVAGLKCEWKGNDMRQACDSARRDVQLAYGRVVAALGRQGDAHGAEKLAVQLAELRLEPSGRNAVRLASLTRQYPRDLQPVGSTIVVWNALIEAHSRAGDPEKALELWQTLWENALTGTDPTIPHPHPSTLCIILDACGHNQCVARGVRLWTSVQSAAAAGAHELGEWLLTANAATSLLEMLCRGLQFDQAVDAFLKLFAVQSVADCVEQAMALRDGPEPFPGTQFSPLGRPLPMTAKTIQTLLDPLLRHGRWVDANAVVEALRERALVVPSSAGQFEAANRQLELAMRSL